MKGITKALGVVGSIADDLITSKEEKLKINLEFAKIEANLAKGQQEINKVEAQHKSIFVAGWRPAVGWICALAFGYNFIFYPFLQYLSVIFDLAEVSKLPSLDLSDMMPVLLGMLGLGGMRTYEKQKGVNSNAIKPKKQKKGVFSFLRKK